MSSPAFPALRRSVPVSPRVVAAAFAVLGLASSLWRYARIRWLGAAPHHDVRGVWRPVAAAVADGAPLYVRPAVDNKPPLFELLNVAVYATGAYLPAFLLLVGVANAAVAVCLWRLLARRGYAALGAAAGLVYLAAVPLVGGAAVNVRSLSTALLVFAFVRSGPARSGVALAAACLVSQHAVFGAPVVVADGLARTDASQRWLGRFAIGCCAVVAAAFAAVFALWGRPSVAGAVRWSVGFAGTYVLEWGPSVLRSPGRWLSLLVDGHRRLGPVLGCALGGVAVVASRIRAGRAWTPLALSLCAVAALSLPLLVRSFVSYWLYPLPWIAVLAVVGVAAAARAVRTRFPTLADGAVDDVRTEGDTAPARDGDCRPRPETQAFKRRGDYTPV